MKITTIQTITNTFDESHILLATRVNETYLITPDVGKVLKNKHTGRLFFAGLYVTKEQEIKDYEEIEETKD